MCGIALLMNATAPAEPLRRMVTRISHRGPDGQGYHLLDRCAFGHARLSIIDLSTGEQPMSDVNGRFFITFNGEIYNYRELRHELSGLGHEFKTQSDTEVILAAYEEWGVACLDRLRGMFALAIWDTFEKSLFAARDLFGEKPLYHATAADGSFVAASELKSLLAAGTLVPRLSFESVDAFLTFGYVPPDRTIYANVSTLMPGHYLLWKNGQLRTERYWKPRFGTESISMHDAAERLGELLDQAVRRQMVADVQVGAFLSGGLDSSTIVALMQQHSDIPVKTFSVGFGDLINELPYARAVSQRYRTEHHEIDLRIPNVAELLERMVSVYDEPFADTSHIPTFLVSEFARRYVKVVLSGDGGDELLGGYWWHGTLARAEGLPRSFILWAMMRITSKILFDRNQALRRRAVAFGYAARWPDPWLANVHSHIVFGAAERRHLWGRDSKQYVTGDYYRPGHDVTGLNRGFYFDLTQYLPGDILVKVDRAAMAHGLETRAPFLDRDLVEFALSLPSSLKVDDTRGKLVLREACERLWPRELWNRPKQGFGSPVRTWLALPDVQALAARVFAPGAKLRTLLRGPVDKAFGRRDYRAWTLLSLGLWLEATKVDMKMDGELDDDHDTALAHAALWDGNGRKAS
jgi:asparagine synthase (glutamine-hydrolysing)